jgi:hypothetical protein
MSKKEKRRKFSFLVTVTAGASLRHLIRQLKHHSFDYRYTGRVVVTVIVSAILDPFRWWEKLRWKRKINKIAIDKPPLFIIGFWRSGTTLLHNLLAQTPGAAYITTYQTVFPDLLLSHSWWFKPIIGQFWPTHRPFDGVKMGMDLPQEEEIALQNLQEISFYNFLCFPQDFERFYQKELFIRNQDDRLVNIWKTAYKNMIKKAFVNVKGDWFISKSPSNMARIELILQMFPDARFIFLYRDPYKTVESFYRFFQEVIPAIQLQSAGNLLSRERLVLVYSDMIRKYLEDKNKIDPAKLIEIRFEDFSKEPLISLKRIFEHFSIEGFAEALPNFNGYIEEVSEFSRTNYELPDETIRLVNKYAGDIVDLLGYPRRPDPPGHDGL